MFIIARIVCFARFAVGTTEEGLGQGSVIERGEWKTMDRSVGVNRRPESCLSEGLRALRATYAFSSKRTALLTQPTYICKPGGERNVQHFNSQVKRVYSHSRTYTVGV